VETAQPADDAAPARPAAQQGSNVVMVGDFNERLVLATLRRHGPASKAELSRLVGLTNNATGVIVRKLEGEGLVRNRGKRYGARGQPATLLELDPHGAYSIGLRIDRTKIESVLVDLGGTILDRRELFRLPSPAGAIGHLTETVTRFRKVLGAARAPRLKGIGVGIPYNLGSWLRDLDLPARKFRPWDNFPVARELAAATGLPVILENDGNAAAVGELLHGNSRLTNFLYLFMSAVIGGGLVLGGDYQRGETGNAGDVAVMPVGPSRLASSTAAGAQRTFLMTRASLNALERHYAHCGITVDADRTLADVVERAPRPFEEWLEDACDALSMAVMTSIHLLDIGHVVIDGDLPAPLLRRLIDRLDTVNMRNLAESRKTPVLLAGSLGADAGAVGAASLPLHLTYNPTPAVLTGRGAERG
jgi:predicted NBD/HSP70 family sugar kinase